MNKLQLWHWVIVFGLISHANNMNTENRIESILVFVLVLRSNIVLDNEFDSISRETMNIFVTLRQEKKKKETEFGLPQERSRKKRSLFFNYNFCFGQSETHNKIIIHK